ncbi:hypothetical protein ONZ45_g5759 [Pleurotus djamor]|nr:hypothetical protein ONZ45_g5759 [Pleurotus djamor]
MDIERVPVADDPRTWSTTRKNVIFFIISSAAMIANLCAYIQNPAIQQMEEQLSATSFQISLSLSLYILSQGLGPLIWSAISEVRGRKVSHDAQVDLNGIVTILHHPSASISHFVIGFRVLQGAGSSSLVANGAAVLADIYPPAIRGTKMGIYYTASLLGTSLGPILGGALTVGFSWRACFVLVAIVCGTSWFSFLTFQDTWRKERSLTYQNVLREKVRELDYHDSNSQTPNSKLNPGGDQTVMKSHTSSVIDVAVISDLEKRLADGRETPKAVGSTEPPDIKLTVKDINPLRPICLVLTRINNLIIVLVAGSLFAFGFLILYTTSRTLGSKYQYDAMRIGLVLLSFGIGSLAGSPVGGRYSDYTLRKLKEANGGQRFPEMRLRSTFYSLVLLPPSILGYAWVTQRHVHISAMCSMLFLNGFFTL